MKNLKNPLRSGTKVTITDTKKTDLSFGISDNMVDMIGGVYKIEDCYVGSDHSEIIIKGCCWHNEDLELYDPSISDIPSESMAKDKQLFNPEEILKG